MSRRLAIVNADKCKPRNCGLACKKACPVVKMGKQCILVDATSKIAEISEFLCNGCAICTKKCPNKAISIINLPVNLTAKAAHRYGPNAFKLHRLPMPRAGRVLGLVGPNGVGKTTALKILAGKIKPNLGRFEDPPEWPEICSNFRGSELQKYFGKLCKNNLKCVLKPQYVDQLGRELKQRFVKEMLESKSEKPQNEVEEICEKLGLISVLGRKVGELSGGELQRFAIAMVCVQQADIYMFDEPSSYLDIKQRLQAANVIRSLLKDDNYVIIVEHDLSVLDFLSDYVCLLYGEPTVYGVVTHPSGVAQGINHFMDGFLPTENMRIRDYELDFKMSTETEKVTRFYNQFSYGDKHVKMGTFELSVQGASVGQPEIIVLLGQNGMGKTTFINLLASNDQNHGLTVSYKQQKMSMTGQKGTVAELLRQKIPEQMASTQFRADVLVPLKMGQIADQQIEYLSGGELQRLQIVLCLGQSADLYLIDEPSAYLDSEQRLAVAKTIKRFIYQTQKTAFIVEHDFLMATYLADRVILFTGEPSVKAAASKLQTVVEGFNSFLQQLNVTIRRDPNNHRPRINKPTSALHAAQRKSGNFFYAERL